MKRLCPLAFVVLSLVPSVARADACTAERRCIGEAPLAPTSPWPKFRGNMRQDGLSKLIPASGGRFWVFQTGKGVYSSPVIGGDGTIFVGSADRSFYALNPDGSLKWRHATGEVVDSAALLDDQGRVYFGAGDGKLRALDAATGQPVWTFHAEDPSAHNAFINWFEGNVAIGPDGTLYAPNDNFAVYAVDRTTGASRWTWLMNDQTWSSPAVDPDQGTLYIGNNYISAMRWMSWFWKNIFAINPDGTQDWRTTVRATVASSPMLTGDGTMILGAFDGYTRAYGQRDGSVRWEFPTNDHIYASPGRLEDGTILQASTDGTLYALHPQTGALLWHFDTREPIHSSPSVDGLGRIYFGGGDGRLYVLNSDGSLRWSMQLVLGDRNDLNASPALGKDAVYIAGESGEVFSVPYDYCLLAEGAADARCVADARGALAQDGATLDVLSPLGTALTRLEGAQPANTPLAFGLRVRSNGKGTLALIDERTLVVTTEPATSVTVQVSGDRRFLTVVPKDRFPAGPVRLTVRGDYLIEPTREGLKMTGGRFGGTFSGVYDFDAVVGDAQVAYRAPAADGAPAGAFEMYRLTAPFPTVLPSYNQIGFDSLHYLGGFVEGDATHGIGWMLGGKLDETTGATLPDSATKVLFPVEYDARDGLLTLRNQDGFMINAMSADVPFSTFLFTARLDAHGKSVGAPGLHVTTDCNAIPTYGPFLVSLGFCHPTTGLLNVYGSGLIRPFGNGLATAPQGVGQSAFTVTTRGGVKTLTATLTGSQLTAADHALGLLVVDAATGKPVGLPYGLQTTRESSPAGRPTKVALTLKSNNPLPARVRVYLMVDTYPAAKAELAL